MEIDCGVMGSREMQRERPAHNRLGFHVSGLVLAAAVVKVLSFDHTEYIYCMCLLYSNVLGAQLCNTGELRCVKYSANEVNIIWERRRPCGVKAKIVPSKNTSPP